MNAMPTCRAVAFAGLPATELQLPCGDRVVVAQHGAHILSWVAAGRERLYLSPKARLDGQGPIRGGIPVCFPQFNQRGPGADRLPKHGFARQLPWVMHAPDLPASPAQPDRANMALSLSDSAATRAFWPHAFEARVQIALAPGQLEVALTVRNTDQQAWAFTGALHTYLAVEDVTQARLCGLAGQAEWDAVADRHGTAAHELRFGAEFDRVYSASAAGYTLHDVAHDNAPASTPTLRIEQDMNWAHTVVWNPGADLCATLADMPADGWCHMLCVEAAQVYTPIALAPGAMWQGAQRLLVPHAHPAPAAPAAHP